MKPVLIDREEAAKVAKRLKEIRHYNALPVKERDNRVAAGLLRDARKDIDFLLSLINALPPYTTAPARCVKCDREMTWQEYGPPINDGHWVHLHNDKVFCDDIESSVETVLAAHDSGRVATAPAAAPDGCLKCGHDNVNSKGECRQCIDWEKHICIFPAAPAAAQPVDSLLGKHKDDPLFDQAFIHPNGLLTALP